MFNPKKSINALLYILQQENGSCDTHKLCKILFFADQKHMSEYGRSITGDTYIAMQFGPVPSKTYDLLKAVRGDSFFSGDAYKDKFEFTNKINLKAIAAPDMDELSGSDVECLDIAIGRCKGKSFQEVTDMSHGYAWANTQRDREISVKDILREVGDTEEYVEYIADNMAQQESFPF